MVRWRERMFYLWLHTAKPAWVGWQALMLHRVAMETAGYGGESARQRIWIKFCHFIFYCWLQRVRCGNGNETPKQTYLLLTNPLDKTFKTKLAILHNWATISNVNVPVWITLDFNPSAIFYFHAQRWWDKHCPTCKS